MYWCSGMFKVLTIDSDYLFDWFWLWKTWWTRMFLYKNLPRYLWIDEEEKVGHPKKRKKNQRRSNRPPHLRLTNLRSWLTYSLFPHNVWTLSSDLTWCFGIFHTGKGIFHISQRQIFLQRHLLISDFKLDQCRNAVVSSESKWIVLWNIQNQFYYFTNQNLIKAWYIQNFADKTSIW